MSCWGFGSQICSRACSGFSMVPALPSSLGMLAEMFRLAEIFWFHLAVGLVSLGGFSWFAEVLDLCGLQDSFCKYLCYAIYLQSISRYFCVPLLAFPACLAFCFAIFSTMLSIVTIPL